MVINSKCYSDDHVREAEFDATPWFEQATDDEVEGLHLSDYKNDYPSDNVAMHMAATNQSVSDMFKYLELVAHLKDHPGFECVINKQDALRWIENNKKPLFLKLMNLPGE